ncbi:hypothetical protein B0J11DRAFT_434059 [Dendryphion nanum]|uniref:R3H domain-containing protein 2 n=1 Tax=Dendryphion nanum TaxID=256645 RepID=A0A9P9DSD3_9PLEO|nr:hypothetical protein B0J11DRAFT_434059 [Dendryphion nanum]
MVTSPPPIAHSHVTKHSVPDRNENVGKAHVQAGENKAIEDISGAAAIQTEQWANASGQQVVFQPGSTGEEADKLPPSITLVKSLGTEDNTTQLSSSDGSAKPPSLDGKSIASATTFALDEKESIRPDDSASLRAVEEEDVASPPDSVAAGSRVGSDSGVARAFRDQLHEIAVMGPVPQRGAPPGRFPNSNTNGPHTLYDPNQPPNAIGQPLTQPLANGLPNLAGQHAIPATPDEKLTEALESPRDRLFVLKLEQDFIDFIQDSRENEFSLPNCNTFYRMLAHRLADYYLLGHVVDNTMTGVKITRTPYCRIPPPLSSLQVSSKSTSTPPVEMPTRKIMRREDGTKSGTNTTANSEGPSKTTSEVGGGSGSEGGEGNEQDSKDKSALTREEREARYREARQRIFGNADTEDTEATDIPAGEEKDASRSSSASGKKKNRKQRNFDDDFEARSRFNAYYSPQYPVSGYGGDQTVYYGGYAGPMQNPQFPGMNANVSPPPTYNAGYPSVSPQDGQASYGWPTQQFQPNNGPMAYSNYGPGQNGYDLSGDFQRGMQSFQSAGIPSQVTPKMSNAPMASFQDLYQPPPHSMNPGWPQMNQQPPFPMAQPPYNQNGPNNRPMSAPIQAPVPGNYPYGQFPPPTYNGRPNRNQHPLPGSFQRPQFNPQSQAFVPGGRNVSYQMSPNMPPMPLQGMNGYGNFQMSGMQTMTNQMPDQQPFGSPRSPRNDDPGFNRADHPNSSQVPQIASSYTVPAGPLPPQASPNSVPAQSSIAKWGTPSHLPPKPPAPAQPQAPKFTLPGHGQFPPISRLPNSIGPGFIANPMQRGGPNMPNAN